MLHLKVLWVARLQFLPKAPNAKVLVTHLCVVKQHHRTGGELGQPGLEIVLDRFIGVQSIDVEQINAVVFKSMKRVVKGFPQKGGEVGVVGLVVRRNRRKNVRVVGARVHVSLPSVHGKAAGGHRA